MCSCGCGANSLCAPFLAPNAKSALVPGLDTAMVLMRQGRNHDTENSSGRGGGRGCSGDRPDAWVLRHQGHTRDHCAHRRRPVCVHAVEDEAEAEVAPIIILGPLRASLSVRSGYGQPATTSSRPLPVRLHSGHEFKAPLHVAMGQEPPSATPRSMAGRRSSLADLAALDHDGLQM